VERRKVLREGFSVQVSGWLELSVLRFPNKERYHLSCCRQELLRKLAEMELKSGFNS
jgi:hypothetical protein